jgi:hypothetical protein
VATVHGKFKHHNEKASGTIELKDTGSLRWTGKEGRRLTV